MRPPAQSQTNIATKTKQMYDQMYAAVVILKAKILVSSSVYRSRNKTNGRHQTLLLG